MLWKLWLDEYVRSLRERTRNTQRLAGNNLILILSTDGKIKTATVRAASGKLINRVLNFLFTLQNPKLAMMKSNDSENVPKQEPKRAANDYIIFLKQEYTKLMRENPPQKIERIQCHACRKVEVHQGVPAEN